MEPDDDRPIEVPISKRPISNRAVSNRPTRNSIDPRFDPKCAGNSDYFQRNYSFLDEYRQKELAELEKLQKKEKDPGKKQKIKAIICSKKNQAVERANKPANSKEKKERIVDKFKELKQTGKLSKYLERKRKKLISRDSKHF